ncbi:hypothetical protein [Anatilimnocola floriformis]|uniref:hypothetical protein n=1 Tax=Anatilimnocola floriformis TaxID=2948575 RepID=UPI0020C40BED|nr:hypothetical protein [Anatilimnocola floriformis]
MNAPASKSESSSAPVGGKAVVIGIFVVGLIAAASGLVYKYFASREPLEMWGTNGIQVIQSAPRVELLTLGDEVTADSELLTFAGQALPITATHDISKAPGLIHHRHFLTEYVSYVDRPAAASEMRSWKYAVRFRDGGSPEREVVVLFNLPERCLGNLHTGQEVRVVDKIAENWKRFIERQLAETRN